MDIKQLNEELEILLAESKAFDTFLDNCELLEDKLDQALDIVKKYVTYDEIKQSFTQEDEKDDFYGYYSGYRLFNDNFEVCTIGIAKPYREYARPRKYQLELNISPNVFDKQNHIFYTLDLKELEDYLKRLVQKSDNLSSN